MLFFVRGWGGSPVSYLSVFQCPAIFILGIAPAAQILRGSRLRKEAPGESWSDAARAAHEAETIRMLRFKKHEKGLPVWKTIKVQNDAEHVASWDWLAALINAVKHSTGHCFDTFFHSGPLPLDRVPRSLFVTMDFLQLQWRVLWFLRNHIGLSLEGIIDKTHRVYNDISAGLMEADFGVVRDKALLCVNAHYGPWDGGGFHGDLLETAKDLATNASPDDPELDYFWPKIAENLKLPPEMHGRAGRIDFLRGLPNLKSIRTKGLKASKSKWSSLQVAWSDHVDAFVAADCYVGTHLSKRRKWIKSITDLSPACSPVDALLKYSDAPIAEPAGAASSSGAGMRPAPKTKAAPKASVAKKQVLARETVKTDRKGSKNLLHYVIRCKMDDHFVQSVRMLMTATAPPTCENARYRSDVLSADETTAYFAEQAAGAWAKPLVSMLDSLRDVKGLEKCGFLVDAELAAKLHTESAEVYIQDAWAQKYANLVYSVIRHTASSAAWHTDSYPGALARLAHTDATEVGYGMKAFELCLKSVAWCEEGCPVSRELAERSMLKSKLMAWCGEQARATGFTTVNDLLRAFLADCWSGPLQTVLNENLNKHVRDQETRATTSNKNAVLTRWHNLLFRHDLEHYHRTPPVQGFPEAAFGRDVDIDDLFFPSSRIESELGLDRILGENCWQTWNSQTIKRAYSEQNLMLQAYEEQDRAFIAKSWRTGLIPVKQVVEFTPLGGLIQRPCHPSCIIHFGTQAGVRKFGNVNKTAIIVH